jgi:hypothetical protein
MRGLQLRIDTVAKCPIKFAVMDDFPSARYYVIDLDRLTKLEQVARLFAIIAYPEFEKHKHRDLFGDALNVWAMRAIANLNPRWIDDPQPIRPRLLLQDEKTRNKALKGGCEILKTPRMLGLHVGEERYDNFERAILAGQVVNDIPHLSDRKVKETYDIWFRQRRIHVKADKSNLYTRWWKSTALVFHLLIEMRPYLRRDKSGRYEFDLQSFFAKEVNIKKILVEAAKNRDYVRSLFELDQESPVRVDWEV